jgi:hypothetical protein
VAQFAKNVDLEADAAGADARATSDVKCKLRHYEWPPYGNTG